MFSIRPTAALAALCLLLTSCGGGEPDADTPQAQPLAAARKSAVASPYAGVEVEHAVRQLFNFAEYRYGAYFPASQPTQESSGFIYRYYPTSQAYLGVAVNVTPGDGLIEGGVYVKGGVFGSVPRYLGQLTNFIAPVATDFAAAQGQVTPAGGTLATPGGEVALEFDSGALETSLQVAIAPITLAGVVGNAAQVTPAPTPLWTQSRLWMKYSSAKIPPGWSYWGLSLAARSGANWVDVPTLLDETTETLVGNITSLSTFGIKTAQPAGVTNPSGFVHWPFTFYWEMDQGCWRTTNDPQYNWRLGELAKRLFKLASAPGTGTGCVINPYMTAGHSRFQPTLESHPGIDFRADSPVPVYAIAEGQVELATLDAASHQSTLIIRSTIAGSTYRIAYQHCQAMPHFRGSTNLGMLAVGTTVKEGDQVCVSGSVGAITPHLHVEAKRMGMDQNRLAVMQASHCTGLSFLGYNGPQGEYDALRSGCSTQYLKLNTIDPSMLVIQPVTKGWGAFANGEAREPGDVYTLPPSPQGNWHETHMLATPIPLASMPAGFTLAFFSTNNPQAAPTLRLATRFPPWDPCFTTTALGSMVSGTLTVNGVTGTYTNYAASGLNFIVQQPAGCNRTITLADYDLVALAPILDDTTDAVWIAKGVGVLP